LSYRGNLLPLFVLPPGRNKRRCSDAIPEGAGRAFNGNLFRTGLPPRQIFSPDARAGGF